MEELGEPSVDMRIHRTMLHHRAGRIQTEIVPAIPVVLRPDRAGTKSAPAIRTDIVEDVFDAGTAEGAFECANHRFR